jgi:hypothetical protein
MHKSGATGALPQGNSSLKRIPRDPVRFDVFKAFAAGTSVSLHDSNAIDGFKSIVEGSLSKSLSNPKFLYGQHVQAMFQGVVIALGQVQMIKEEDAGGGWYEGEELSIPDYRIILHDGSQFLVEVKNHNGDHFEVTFTKTYIEGLRRYGAFTRADIKLAIYWVGWQTWTLASLDILEERENSLVLPFGKALAANELALVGDASIATRFPLVLRLVADRSKPRTLSEAGEVQFTIGETRLYCAGEEITDQKEKEIAFMLMLAGRWEEAAPTAELEGNLLSAVAFECHPQEDHKQGFEFIGSLSEIFSSLFTWRTLEGGRVSNLVIDLIPAQMADLIPKNYKGQALPLWRFTLKPSRNIPLA